MHLTTLISPTVPALALGLSACVPVCAEGVTCNNTSAEVAYLGVETQLLEGDLVRFQVAIAADQDDPAAPKGVAAYADCAAAQYALIRGFGFARHLRTNVTFEQGTWRGDAAYTISSAIPGGLKTIDAEVIVSDCHENGIPTV